MKVRDCFSLKLDENLACLRCRVPYRISDEPGYISGICTQCTFEKNMIAFVSYEKKSNPIVNHITIYLSKYHLKMGWGRLYIGPTFPSRTQLYYGSYDIIADVEIQDIDDELVRMLLSFQ